MMSLLLYWIKAIFYRSIIYIYKTLCAISYWKRGKTVPPIRNPLLLKSAKNLAEDIRNGKLKSKDIIQAYIERIQEVEPYINAVVQDRFEEALIEAAEVDELVLSNALSKQKLEEEKPLLGVPITVKHIFKVKGCLCTAGSKFFKDRVAEEDAPCIAIVKKAGGIVIATTNIPEFSLLFETNNPLYGRTCNPYNTSRTSGGSSGGESALIAAGASIIGIGNDLGGSVRLPAHFSGLYSHKGTKDLMPSDGIFPVLPEELYNYISVGPMCRYVEDLSMMVKILSADPEISVKIDKKVDFEKLKVFYWTSIRDPRVLPVDEDIEKNIHIAVSHFTSYGVTAQELKTPNIHRINDIVAHLLQAPIENFADFLTGGKIKQYHTFREIFKVLIGKSNFSFATLIVLYFLQTPIFARREYIPYYRDLLKKLTEELDNILDNDSVIICPLFPCTAPYHNEFILLQTLGACYSSLCNFTGLPGTAIPTGLNKNGMPQGIQIIGKINNDSLTLACAVELSKAFGGWIPPNVEGDR